MRMDWHEFFNDLEKWMEASNIMIQRHSFTSEEYWKWLVETIGVIEKRYNNHPLVVMFLTDILIFQDKQYRQMED